MINMLEYGLLTFKDYTGMFKVSLKFNNEIYEYPSVVYSNTQRSSYVVIDEERDAELFNMILYLLSSQTPFKLRLEKYSTLGIDYKNSYICEMPATNFLEVYNAVYPSVVG